MHKKMSPCTVVVGRRSFAGFGPSSQVLEASHSSFALQPVTRSLAGWYPKTTASSTSLVLPLCDAGELYPSCPEDEA